MNMVEVYHRRIQPVLPDLAQCLYVYTKLDACERWRFRINWCPDKRIELVACFEAVGPFLRPSRLQWKLFNAMII